MGKGNGEPLRTFQTIISDLSILTKAILKVKSAGLSKQ